MRCVMRNASIRKWTKWARGDGNEGVQALKGEDKTDKIYESLEGRTGD